MNIFKSGSEKKLERDLAATRADRAKLAERLAAAEITVAERRAQAKDLARAGAGDADLDVAEAALRAAEDRVATLIGAKTETDAQVATLESAVAQAADQKLRRQTADAIEKLADEVTTAASTFDADAAALLEASERAAAIIPDALGLKSFVGSVRSELPAAIRMVAQILRDRAAATLAGTAPAGLAQPAPPPVIVPPKPEVKTVFFLKHAKYRDADGKLTRLPKFHDADLEPSLAARALRLGVACEVTDPRRKTLFGIEPPHLPNEQWCENIGDDEPEQREVVTHGAFQKLDRGPGFTIRVPRGPEPEPVAAARSADLDNTDTR